MFAPKTDLCWTCQQGIGKLQKSRNESDETKTKAVQDIEAHLKVAKTEREFYKEQCKEAVLPEGSDFGKTEPCSHDGPVHYSFDFAQQVHYPADPLQPGPIYFKTPRKCGIFGIHCEAINKQMNYLIDEACAAGKGADCVVSLLHHFFENYGLGETELQLHCDNCSEQNKNSCLMWYMLWRVLTGRSKSVHVSFLIAGHTKFSPDRCFGVFKTKFNVNKVNTLDDIADCMSGPNQSHKIGLDHAAPENMLYYQWTDFLSKYFRKIEGILSYQHFCFSAEGVTLKKFSTSDAEPRDIIKELPPKDAMPPLKVLPGLSRKRQEYLYKEVRQFVEPLYQDVVCPMPTAPEMPPPESPSTSQASPDSPPPQTVPQKETAPRKRNVPSK